MIIDIFLPLSLVFIMFTLGLGLTLDDFSNVAREPKAFGVGIFNQMICLPIVAFGVVLLSGLSKEMAVGMMILASCPGGVTSNIITKLAKGDTALSISFTAVISILSVISLPIITGFSMKYFMGADAPPLNILSLGLTMFFITAIPVGIGLFIRFKYKNFAKLFEPIGTKITTFLFVIIVFSALASEWDLLLNNILVLGPSICILIFVMLTIGYQSSKLFKMDEEKSIAISIESGIQNATVGITIGNLIIYSEGGISLFSLPSGLYGILMYLVCMPFIYWLIKFKIKRV
tara:strand:- start:135 stop:1001 length:867 start_codon:yes stop_codon:yes gene_type:complete